MADILNRTLPPRVDPYAEMIAAQRARIAALQNQAPMYTPEQVQQRRDANEREYQLGLLGMLSGSDTLGKAGGFVLKNALEARQPKVTERGVADPLSGQFNYNPDYLHERESTTLDTMLAHQAAALQRDQSAKELLAQRQEGQALIKTLAGRGGGGDGLGTGAAQEIAIDADGRKVFRESGKGSGGQVFVYDDNFKQVPPRGALSPKQSGGGPSEDERKAAGWLSQAKMAYANMRAASALEPSAAQPSIAETAVGMVPKVGSDLAYARMSPARQKFTTAASSLSEAVLRAATGAGVGNEEAMQKVRELTPRFGEDPTTTKMKEQMAEMYINSLQARAGRAAPAAAATVPGGAPDNDPLGMRSK